MKMLVRDDLSSLYLRHQIVVGIGEWGQRTLSYLADALETSHPELIHLIECLNVDANGIHWSNLMPALAIRTYEESSRTPSPSPRTSSSPLHQCLDAYAGMLNQALRESTGGEKTKELANLGFLPLSGDQPLLDIHIIGRMEEAIIQEVLLPLTRTLQANRPVSLKFRLYFYLGTDTTQWINFTHDERISLCAFVEQLDQFLVDEASRSDAGEDSCRICYLIDTVDEETRAIASSQQNIGIGEPRISALAEMVAGFLSLLICSEIPELQEYAALGLDQLIRQSGLPNNQAYCSSLGLAGYAIPLRAIQCGLSINWAIDLLNRFTPELSTDREQGSDLVFEFSTNHTFDQKIIREQLIKDDETGSPIRFEFDPSILDDVPDEDLVDRILSWNALVERNKLPPKLKQIEDHAHMVASEAQTWIRKHVDILVLHPDGRTGTARLMCRRLREHLLEEREIPKSRKQSRWHWISELFSPPLPEPERKYPDLKKLQHKLQRTLGERVNRLAVWQRFAMLAGVECMFLLAAWPYLSTALKILLGGVQGVVLAQIGLWVTLPLILILNVLWAFFIILRSEQKIIKARNKLVKAIQQRHQLKLQLQVEGQLAQIYDHLEAILNDELVQIDQWVQLIEASTEELTAIATIGWKGSSRSYESALIDPADIPQFIPQFPTSEIDLTFARMMHKNTLGNWRDLEKSHIQVKVLRFVEHLVPDNLAELSIEAYMESRKGRFPLPILVRDLQEKTKIQLDLTGFPTAHRLSFMAVDDRRLSQVSKTILNPNQTKPVTTLDRSRITYIGTIHGLLLKDLKIWENLS